MWLRGDHASAAFARWTDNPPGQSGQSPQQHKHNRSASCTSSRRSCTRQRPEPPAGGRMASPAATTATSTSSLRFPARRASAPIRNSCLRRPGRPALKVRSHLSPTKGKSRCRRTRWSTPKWTFSLRMADSSSRTLQGQPAGCCARGCAKSGRRGARELSVRESDTRQHRHRGHARVSRASVDVNRERAFHLRRTLKAVCRVRMCTAAPPGVPHDCWTEEERTSWLLPSKSTEPRTTSMSTTIRRCFGCCATCWE